MAGRAVVVSTERLDTAHYRLGQCKWSKFEPGFAISRKKMTKTLTALGYSVTELTAKEATVSRVLKEIGNLAVSSAPGDIAVVYFATHGGCVEIDGARYLSLVFYDRMMLSRELDTTWSAFKGDVRIVQVSDTCHAGDNYLNFIVNKSLAWRIFGSLLHVANPCKNKKQFDPKLQWVVDANPATYAAAARGLGALRLSTQIIHFGACQDGQEAKVFPDTGGLFTSTFVFVLSGPEATSYDAFFSLVKSDVSMLTSGTQVPNMVMSGPEIPGFQAQKPLKI
jgi:hypothetical protein